MGEEVKETKAEAKARRKAAAAAAKAKRLEAKAAARGEKGPSAIAAAGDDGAMGLTSEQKRVAAARAVTGVLASSPQSRDVQFDSFSLMVGGNKLVNDCSIVLNWGCRYGLIGSNGSGKSNVISAIAQREVPVPDHIDIFHLHEQAPPSELTGVEAVVSHIKKEGERIEAMVERIIEESGPEDERLEGLYERLEDLDPQGSEPRARKILSGLGFADDLIPMDRKTKNMSGGWRMRVALAQALFAAPSLLLLDEPTAHLDLESCVWLEEHLARYNKILMVVSHSQDFLNHVCTDMVWLHDTKTGPRLDYYGGNYEMFCKVVADEEAVQLKQYKKQQADIEKLANYVRVNKANGVAASAKSKQKVLDKVLEEAVTKPVLREPSLVFEFPEVDRLPPPVLPFDDVSFSYSGKPEDYLYENLSLAVDYDSRIALVGPNGCGKSTLLKLMSGELGPTEGQVKKHAHLTLGLYHQHSCDVLDNDLSPLEFFRKTFPPPDYKYTVEMWRAFLAKFNFSTSQQTSKIGMLSSGQKKRIAFAMLSLQKNTGVLLLDEPTNNLDVESVEGLAAAIKSFQGGVVLVSHDFRLIDAVAKDIWVCENKGVRRYDGTIHQYKAELSKKLASKRV